MIKAFKTTIKAVYYTYMGALGCGCSVMLLLAISFLMAAGVGTLAQKQNSLAMSNSGMLLIDLSLQIDEAPTQLDPFMNFLHGTQANIGILDLSEKIRAAADDPLIGGIVLMGSAGGGTASFSQISEIRGFIEEFKTSSKKPVYAYLENPTQADYYLASAATMVYTNTASTLEFKGVRLKSMFIGNALKKYGVNAELIRAGKYKSAGEFFTSDQFSPESRNVYTDIAEGIWGNVLGAVSESRKIGKDDLKQIADTKALITSKDALKLRLADVACPRDYFEEQMTDLAGDLNGSFNNVPVEFYSPKFSRNRRSNIAVLFIDGQIVEGNMRKRGYVTCDFYAEIIREIKADPKIKGVVLRINSPGGSAFASEILRREIQLLSAEKPVVASFGSSAASGAYWISAGVQKIVAEENCLTGSIGVFGLALSGDTLAGNFGLTFDSVETSPLADIMSGTRPMTDKERAIIQSLIDDTYEDFLKIVSTGRDMPHDKVDEIAQGRVWLASRAKETGLFDEIGNINRAIQICAELANLPENTGVIQYPQPETLQDLLVQMQGRPFAKIKEALLPRDLSKTLEQIDFKNAVRAQTPHIINVEN